MMIRTIFLVLFFVSQAQFYQVHLALGSEIKQITRDQQGGFYLAGLANDAAQLRLEAKAKPLSFVAHLDSDFRIKHLKSFPSGVYSSSAKIFRSSMIAFLGTATRSFRLVGCAMPSEVNAPTSLPLILTVMV